MVKKAKNFLSELPQYAEPWIVFDKDENQKFDSIIEEAENSNIKVAWSNPCIEAWLYAYFGKMPNYQDSVTYCNEFSKILKKMVGQEYNKSDNGLYKKMYEYGDEKKAIEIVEKKMTSHKNNCKKLPSEMVPATTVHKLLKEIKNKL